MKKLTTLILIAILSITTASCASAPKTTDGPYPLDKPPATSSPAIQVGVEVAKVAGRLGLQIALQRAGVPDAIIPTVIAQVCAVVDAAISGQGISVVLDPARWAAARADLLDSLGAEVEKATIVDGVPIVTKEAAIAILTPIVDAAADSIRERISKP